MKLQWKTVSEEQKIRFSQLRDRENLIGNLNFDDNEFIHGVFNILFQIKTKMFKEPIERIHIFKEMIIRI